MTFAEHFLTDAHKHCKANRRELESSRKAGCIYCKSIYSALDVIDYVEDSDTAICPVCPVDAVIGDASGLPIEKEFLTAMHERWFGDSTTATRIGLDFTAHAETRIDFEDK